jgi:hypothetical protein
MSLASRTIVIYKDGDGRELTVGRMFRNHSMITGLGPPMLRRRLMAAGQPYAAAPQHTPLFLHDDVDGPDVPGVAGLCVIEDRNPHVELAAGDKVLIVFAACLELATYNQSPVSILPMGS